MNSMTAENTRTAGWWPAHVRMLVATLLFGTVLLANEAAVDQSVAFVAGTHLPLLVAYVVLFRRAWPCAVAAAGLLTVTIGVWLDIADSDAPDELAFAWLTNAVLWASVLVAAGATSSLLSRR